jgi:hypothetical protein
MEQEGTFTVWSFRRLALLSLVLAGALGLAVFRDWRVMEMVTGLALLPVFAVAVFRAVLDSLLLP